MDVKSHSLTVELHSKLSGSSVIGVKGIPGVRVKSVDIGKNTNGEGNLLGFF